MKSVASRLEASISKIWVAKLSTSLKETEGFPILTHVPSSSFIWKVPSKVQGTMADSDMPENTGDAIDTMNTGGPKGVGADKAAAQ